MLEDRRWRKRVPERKSYKDVVQDYFQCHRKTEKTENWNLKALFQAMCVAIKHGEIIVCTLHGVDMLLSEILPRLLKQCVTVWCDLQGVFFR